MTLLDRGPDVLLKGVAAEGLSALEALTSFATEHGLARLSIDQGLGPETLYQPQPATMTLSGVPVAFPPGGFLQATEDGEEALVDAVRRGDRRCPADRGPVRGLGTFALAVRRGICRRSGARCRGGAEARGPSNQRSSTAICTAGRWMPPNSGRSMRSSSTRRAPELRSRSGRWLSQRRRASPTSAVIRRLSRVTPRRWSRGATGSTGSNLSASSAGRPTSSWPPLLAVRGSRNREGCAPRRGSSGRTGTGTPARIAGSGSARRSPCTGRCCARRESRHSSRPASSRCRCPPHQRERQPIA